MAVSQQKHALRTIYRKTRKSTLPSVDISSIADRVTSILSQELVEGESNGEENLIACYYPIPGSGEIDILSSLARDDSFFKD